MAFANTLLLFTYVVHVGFAARKKFNKNFEIDNDAITSCPDEVAENPRGDCIDADANEIVPSRCCDVLRWCNKEVPEFLDAYATKIMAYHVNCGLLENDVVSKDDGTYTLVDNTKICSQQCQAYPGLHDGVLPNYAQLEIKCADQELLPKLKQQDNLISVLNDAYFACATTSTSTAIITTSSTTTTRPVQTLTSKYQIKNLSADTEQETASDPRLAEQANLEKLAEEIRRLTQKANMEKLARELHFERFVVFKASLFPQPIVQIPSNKKSAIGKAVHFAFSRLKHVRVFSDPGGDGFCRKFMGIGKCWDYAVYFNCLEQMQVCFVDESGDHYGSKNYCDANGIGNTVQNIFYDSTKPTITKVFIFFGHPQDQSSCKTLFQGLRAAANGGYYPSDPADLHGINAAK